MTRVKSVIRRHLEPTPSPSLGPAEEKTSVRRDALANDLLDVSRRNQLYFVACFGTVVVALAGAAAITLRFLNSPETIRTIFGVLGISITGLMVQMTSLWKQKVLADTVLVLCRNIDESRLESFLEVLLNRL